MTGEMMTMQASPGAATRQASKVLDVYREAGILSGDDENCLSTYAWLDRYASKVRASSIDLDLD